ncbi:MAG TPA: hypothetical protein PLL72_10500 [Burkholderiaceae bacterium]|nr:hypothetical protein [Burkholderiaceae bacterium]
MAISTTVRTAGPFAGTGSLVALPFAFKIFVAADLLVQHTSTSGAVTILTLTTNYSVSLNADQDTSPGGTVTLVTAHAVGETVMVTSNVSATQPLQLASGGPFLPGQIEDALDRMMIIVQQQGVLGDQTLRLPLGETAPVLPGAEQRANKALLFGPGGAPFLGAPASGSAAELALQLASTESGGGASTLGVQDAAGDWSGATQEAVNAEIGFLLIRSGSPVNALRAFTSAEQAAITAKTSTTDHQAQLADLLGNNKAVYFPHGRYNGSAAITITNALHIGGARTAELRFTDGAYTALRFTGSGCQLSTVENVFMRGSNTSTPTISLLKFDTAAAYNVVRHCRFAYAENLLTFDGTYETKVYGNECSNANTYVICDDTTGGTADMWFAGNTYATSLIGSGAMVQAYCPGVRFEGDYWEPQGHSKTALLLGTGSLLSHVVGCRFEASGEVQVQSSVDAHIVGCILNDVYSTASNRALRVESGGNAFVVGGRVALSALDATKTGISAAGALVASGGLDVKNFGVGILAAGAGSIDGVFMRSNTTGIQLNSGATTLLGKSIAYSGNTTDVVNNAGATAKAPGAFTASLTGCSAAVTGTARYVVDNDVCTLYLPGLTGTSNATSATITGLPASMQPGSAVFGTALLSLDNGVEVVAQCDITAGVITLYRNGSATGWTASGTKGIRAQTITYRMRNV